MSDLYDGMYAIYQLVMIVGICYLMFMFSAIIVLIAKALYDHDHRDVLNDDKVRAILNKEDDIDTTP